MYSCRYSFSRSIGPFSKHSSKHFKPLSTARPRAFLLGLVGNPSKENHLFTYAGSEERQSLRKSRGNNITSIQRTINTMATSHTLVHKDERDNLRAVDTGVSQLALDGEVTPLTPNMTKGMEERLQKIQDVGTRGRRLIVGCDGTWVNSDDSAEIPSNVTRLCRALRTSRQRPSTATGNTGPARREQVIYYHRGIGTNGELVSKWIGGGTGNELSEHARECYGFICNNWKEGDDIFLFGFSRGAYTARAVSALIADVGLLTAIGMEWFYEIFEDWKNQNIPSKQVTGPVTSGLFNKMSHRPKMPSDEYKNELKKRGLTTLDVPVTAVGVWDTVGALGIPPVLGHHWSTEEILQYSFVNTKVAQCVVHAIQALGLDEHRAAFSPAVWETPDAPNNLKTLRQCWFPGVHCNVGGAGGYEDQGLANIALAWMVNQIQTITNSDGTQGLLNFDEEYLKWVFNQNIVHVDEADHKLGYRGWGLGKIEETLTAEYSLVGEHKSWSSSKSLKDWLTPGDLPRTPGRYEEINADRGKGEKTGRMLKGTNEKVHPSVRIRVVNGGKGIFAGGEEPNNYTPKAMQGWHIVGEGNIRDALIPGYAWKSEDGKVLLYEDTMGRFEKELLGLSVESVALRNAVKK